MSALGRFECSRRWLCRRPREAACDHAACPCRGSGLSPARQSMSSSWIAMTSGARSPRRARTQQHRIVAPASRSSDQTASIKPRPLPVSDSAAGGCRRLGDARDGCWPDRAWSSRSRTGTGTDCADAMVPICLGRVLVLRLQLTKKVDDIIRRDSVQVADGFPEAEGHEPLHIVYASVYRGLAQSALLAQVGIIFFAQAVQAVSSLACLWLLQGDNSSVNKMINESLKAKHGKSASSIGHFAQHCFPDGLDRWSVEIPTLRRRSSISSCNRQIVRS